MLAPLTHSLAPNCSLRLRASLARFAAFIRSLARSLTHSGAHGKEVCLWNERVDFIQFHPIAQCQRRRNAFNSLLTQVLDCGFRVIEVMTPLKDKNDAKEEEVAKVADAAISGEDVEMDETSRRPTPEECPLKYLSNPGCDLFEPTTPAGSPPPDNSDGSTSSGTPDGSPRPISSDGSLKPETPTGSPPPVGSPSSSEATISTPHSPAAPLDSQSLATSADDPEELSSAESSRPTSPGHSQDLFGPTPLTHNG